MPAPLAQDIDYHGLPAIHLRAPDGAEAIILLHGAHLVSWKPAGGEERLYMSEKALFEDGKPVRGGVPICFPQFGKTGPLPQHGFVRDRSWEKVSARAGDDFAMAVLRLTDSEATRALWPHAFKIEFSVAITASRLDMELEVENTGEAPLRFTTALHTYIRVKEAEEAHLEGLRGQQYRDLLTGQMHSDSGTFVAIDRETTRQYLATENPLLLRDDRRALGINAENMPDTVVWNPWEATCATIADLPPSAFRRFLCVEAGAIESPVELPAGEGWWGRQSLVAM
ncbi:MULTISPECIES: D-hexose-6-phosphate mutarotase [unclassified Uliginosibacterium]|uniref:D-hexose-6-phosphate mutarotase n=1 Tax=unclassified Uliginosibacterium TaxID=2621521 RepID=UPI000C7DFF33|nr:MULTISPECIES: D-hexose-6-phosphate mutarotase [unclassified Uliginosibacterium]MDO6388021.1 D-hexose-6-phosphate mutarotase [Uliginosibacterium sp. 31-12]PLK48159.1 D-hexose-6-phosphate mutarotase [Uliginosibacterium sp. TH139]